MKVLKYIALSLGVLLVVLLIVGLCLPQSWSVERSLVIKAEPAQIHPLVGNLESWPKWMPWMADDPKMQISFGGQAGATGSTMHWKSAKMGNGTLTVETSDAAAGLHYSMMMDEFTEPAHGSIGYAPEGLGTRVTWRDSGTIGKNPLARLMGPLMQSLLGTYFDKGLATIKSLVETG